MRRARPSPESPDETQPRDGTLSNCQLNTLILDSIHDGVVTTDAEFRITSFNASAERITGIPKEQAIGRKCYEVLRTSICQTGCALKRTFEAGRPLHRLPIDLLDASMKKVPIEVSTAVLREGDRMLGGVEIIRDASETEALRQELLGKNRFRNLVGASAAMREVFATLPEIAQSDAPVLIEGPSGTGKELVAQAVHELSTRRDKAFVKVNCAALPDSLLESELFGFEKGAFTDARRDKPGRFALADHGTIFLDEIGDVSPAFQAKLLRVLQEGEIQPLGSTRTVAVDVRLVAATNKDLRALVAGGRFREDLYYRLRVVPILLPSLRDRREDIPLLVHHFLTKLSSRTGKSIGEVSPEALEILQRYSYPGNIRELENALHRAFVLCRGARIEVEHLPKEWWVGEGCGVEPRESTRHGAAGAGPDTLGSAAAGAERDGILRALERHNWNRTAAARSLGIARNTLWRKMRASGIRG